MEVPGTPFGAPFFEFELKPTGKDCAVSTQHEFQHHILWARRNPHLNIGLELSVVPKELEGGCFGLQVKPKLPQPKFH